MGGHGGLNILPQKKWNVYNFDNREKVRKDEEEAAQREHVRRQEERQKDAESRLEKLRQVVKQQRYASSSSSLSDEIRGEDNGDEDKEGKKPLAGDVLIQEMEAKKPSGDDVSIQEMKLFEGLVSFKRMRPGEKDRIESSEFKNDDGDDDEEEKKKKRKLMFRGDKELERLYRRAEKEATRLGKDGITADDEHYKLGYGCLGRDKKKPWYLTGSSFTDKTETGSVKETENQLQASSSCGKKRKKTIEELREERLKREEQERKRAQKMITSHPSNGLRTIGGSINGGRRPYYNSSYGNAR